MRMFCRVDKAANPFFECDWAAWLTGVVYEIKVPQS